MKALFRVLFAIIVVAGAAACGSGCVLAIFAYHPTGDGVGDGIALVAWMLIGAFVAILLLVPAIRFINRSADAKRPSSNRDNYRDYLD